jgi:predicted component of type VI protein secretion system
MADSQVSITVSKEVIDAHVKAAVVAALNKDPEALVKAVVNAAMNQKDRNSYSSDGSIWDQQVNAMIREVAKATFDEWLAEMKPMIAREVRQRLAGKNGKKTIDDIVEKLSTALGGFQVSICIPRE